MVTCSPVVWRATALSLSHSISRELEQLTKARHCSGRAFAFKSQAHGNKNTFLSLHSASSQMHLIRENYTPHSKEQFDNSTPATFILQGTYIIMSYIPIEHMSPLMYSPSIELMPGYTKCSDALNEALIAQMMGRIGSFKEKKDNVPNARHLALGGI